MARRLVAGLLAAGLSATGLLLVPAPAFAQRTVTSPATPPVTKVTIQKNLVETFVQALPSCTEGGPLYTNTTTSTHIERTTTFGDGRGVSTFTAVGKFVAAPLEDPALPSFTGSFTASGRVELQNNEEVSAISTLNERGTGSDGSRFNVHTVEQITVLPDGTEQRSFRCH